MSSSPAFVTGATVSVFTPKHVYSSTTPLHPVTPVVSTRRLPLTMTPMATYMEPQAGDPGYKPLPPVPKGFGMEKSEPKKPKKDDNEDDEEETIIPGTTQTTKTISQKGGKKLPVTGGGGIGQRLKDAKSGFDLLKEDVFKSAPERAGIGRQDTNAIMKPRYGEPGYKPEAYETVKVSDLGISPFPEDANAVGKVGGIDAVKKAASQVKKGEKTAKDIKKQVLKIESKEEPKVYDIPDYLKPLPEDTPRKGYSWKNYKGR